MTMMMMGGSLKRLALVRTGAAQVSIQYPKVLMIEAYAHDQVIRKLLHPRFGAIQVLEKYRSRRY